MFGAAMPLKFVRVISSPSRQCRQQTFHSGTGGRHPSYLRRAFQHLRRQATATDNGICRGQGRQQSLIIEGEGEAHRGELPLQACEMRRLEPDPENDRRSLMCCHPRLLHAEPRVSRYRRKTSSMLGCGCRDGLCGRRLSYTNATLFAETWELRQESHENTTTPRSPAACRITAVVRCQA